MRKRPKSRAQGPACDEEEASRRVWGVRLMRAAGRLTKKSGWGLRSLSLRHCERPLATFNCGSTGLGSRSLMSTAQCCRLGEGTIGLRRLMPPCNTT